MLDPARYVVQAVVSGGGGDLYSDPSVVVQTWARGDTNNDEVADFNDVDRVVDAFMNDYGTGTPPLTQQMADLFGTTVPAEEPPSHANCEPQGPDEAVDFKDVSEATAAFQQTLDPCDNPPLDPCADSPPDPSIPPGSTVTLRPGNRYYFTGRQLDVDLRDTDGSATGTVGTPLVVLAHHRARAYNLLHARWMQRDPAEYVDGMNLYEYVRSQPEVGTDPDGPRLEAGLTDSGPVHVFAGHRTLQAPRGARLGSRRWWQANGHSYFRSGSAGSFRRSLEDSPLVAGLENATMPESDFRAVRSWRQGAVGFPGWGRHKRRKRSYSRRAGVTCAGRTSRRGVLHGDQQVSGDGIMELMAARLRAGRRTLAWATVLLMARALPATAGFTDVQPPAPGEASHEEILEGIYGGDFVGFGDDLGNGLWSVFSNGLITATRVDDFDFPGHLNLLSALPGAADDDTWTDGTTVATATARFAAFPQEFGYDLGAGFTKLIDVAGSGFSVSGSAAVTFPPGSVWQWTRADASEESLINAHYSDEDWNSDGLDHMVTYHVVNSLDETDTPLVWLVFWEDLNGPLGNADDPGNEGIPADRDFNDLVVELVVVQRASGRMTGGGRVDAGKMRVTHGFELYCDPTAGPNHLQINWGRGNWFHLTSLDSAACTDDPDIREGSPVAGFDTFEGTGTGRLNGFGTATITFRLTDAGEPGQYDFAEFMIVGRSELVFSGTLNKGNHQAHRE